MTYTIQGEQPFQVLASNFSIGPSNEGYTLQISADGVNYSDLFSVGANVTRMVTGVANGSYYRMSGNNSIVTVNWNKQCNDGQGGGGGEGTGPQGPVGPQGPQGYQGAVGAQGPAGEGSQGGDNTILKATSGMPEGIAEGDVYATFKEATDAEYGSEWEDTNSTDPIWERYYDGNQPQAIRVECASENNFDLHYGCDPWDDGRTITVNKDGNLEIDTNTFTKLDENHWVLSNSDWLTATEGAVIYVDYDGQYVYAYTTNSEKLWIYYISDNKTGNNVYTGEVTPEKDAEYNVYQSKTVETYDVEIEYIESRWEGGSLFAKGFIATVNNHLSADTAITNIEYFGSRYYFTILTDGDIRITDGNQTLAEISDGDSGNISTGPEYKYSYSDGVFSYKAEGNDEVVWENINEHLGEMSSYLYPDRLAKASELPAENRLMPKNPSDGDMPIYNAQIGWTNTQRDAVFIDGMYAFQNNWQDDGQHYVMTRDGYWGVGWTPSFKMVKMTQADYDALAQGEGYDSNTLYIIIPDTNQGV